MTNTITGTYATLVSLDTALDNPTTITSAAVLSYGLSVSYTGLGVVNAGSIDGGSILGSNGIVFHTAGSVTNQSGGVITGNSDGIEGLSGAVTVVNAGSIASDAGGVGVDLRDGGLVTNQSGGTISSDVFGVLIIGAAGTGTNAGVISASVPDDGFGVNLGDGGSFTNQASGVLSGYRGFQGLGAPTTLTNAGTISGAPTVNTGIGVAFFGAGTLIAEAGGTISGGYDAVLFATGYTGRLVVDPGAVFIGKVNGRNTVGGSGVDTLELASGASAGTLSGLGTQFVDFAQVTVDAGAQFTLTGANTLAAGYSLTDAGTLTNAGALSVYSALTLAPGGVLSNASSGTITTSEGTAVYGAGVGAATVVNAGVIADSGRGIDLTAGGSVINQSGGTISGFDGITGYNAAMTVVNAGSIAGAAISVYLGAGGSVTNQSGGTISGEFGISGLHVAVTVVNAGSIAANATFGDGVYLGAGGSVTNQSGGAITGVIGIYGKGAAVTVVNAGTITGSNDAVQFAAGHANRLVIDPGAVFSGTVAGGNTIGAAYVSTLELASGASAGTLSGLGTQFIDFAQVTVDAGAQFTLAGANTLAAGYTLTNAGALSVYNALTLASGGVLSNASTGTITTSDGTAVYGATGGAVMVVNAGVIAGSGRGIKLMAGGSVTNQSGGAITGYDGIVGYNAAVTVVNAGSIAGNATIGAGVYLGVGGSVTNQSGGAITGDDGVFGPGGTVAVTVVNAGSIVGYGDSGVQLLAGGSVTNQSGGTITGYDDGITGTAVTVVNGGSIAGNAPNGEGIFLTGGSVTNQSGGAISGDNGIEGVSAAVTVVNAGSIAASGGEGVYLFAGGSVTNQSGGAISGEFGILGDGGAVTVVNAGSITANATNGAGVDLLFAGGNVTNQSGGAITGYDGIVGKGGTVTVVNAGSIAATDDGIVLEAGGSVTNQSGGAISGKFGILDLNAAVTVVNAGTITGSTDAIYFDNSGGDLLVVDPGAVFIGNVKSEISGNTLELASTASAGILTGIGSQFTGFGAIQIDTGAAWTVSGSMDGFNDDNISGFTGLDTIDVTGFTVATGTIALGSNDVLTVGDLALTFTSADTGALFTIASDGNGGTDITTDTLCYLRGTRIVTSTGARPVEDIAIGDLLVTRFSGMAKVKWIGRQSFDLRFVQNNRDRLPVRIRAGALGADALGEQLPARDLYVSPGHSMLLDDTLVLARNLVNGVSITQETGMASNPAIIDYFQFELDSHDCVIAEGSWSETYADAPGLRGQFQNAAEFHALYPDYTPPQQLELCAPRPEYGARLDAALRPVVARAGEGILPGVLEGYIDHIDTHRVAGWALDQDHPELPVLLEIRVGERLLGTVLACDHRTDLLAVGKNNGNCSFIYHLPARLPKGALRVVRAADAAPLQLGGHCQTKEERPQPRPRRRQA